ncbi:MAG: hypothetical protein QW279_11010 [Candidatus Jordarchaeaceae archaeon]
MVEAKAWAILGIIGGIFAILEGIVIYMAGVAFQGSLINYITIYFGPNIAAYLNLPADIIALLQQIKDFYMLYWQFISPSLATVLPALVGPLGIMFGWQGGSSLSIAGVAIAVLGVLIIISSLLSMKGKMGAAALILFGIIGTFTLNFGGLLALIGGLALWYE